MNNKICPYLSPEEDMKPAAQNDVKHFRVVLKLEQIIYSGKEFIYDATIWVWFCALLIDKIQNTRQQ